MPVTLSQTLAQSLLFAGLPAVERDFLAASAEMRVFRPGQPLFQCGQSADTLYIINAGHVKVHLPTHEDDGDDPVIDVEGPGALVGETAITGLGVYPVSAEALDAVRAMAISAESLQVVFRRNFNAVLTIMGAVSGTLRGLLGQVVDLKTKSATQRLAMFLVQLTPEGGEGVSTSFPYSKRVLADKLGMAPESLSRCLGKLSRTGMVQCDRDSICVGDRAALTRYAGLDEDGGMW